MCRPTFGPSLRKWRGKWKENAQYDHRTGKWLDKTTGELVQPGRHISFGVRY